jgi:hypothetical protein
MCWIPLYQTHTMYVYKTFISHPINNKNGQSRETGNIGYGTQDEEKHTQYVFDTTMRKQTQIT